MLPIKILVIGPTGSGKTSLVTKLINGTFSSNYVPTDGVDYRSLSVSLTDRSVVPRTIQFWEAPHINCDSYAEQEAYFHDVKAVIIVLDLTKSKTSLKEDLDTFYNIARSADLQNIIIACTKGEQSDEIQDVEKNYEYLQQQISAQYENAIFHRVDAQTSLGIDHFKEQLSDFAYWQELEIEPQPASTPSVTVEVKFKSKPSSPQYAALAEIIQRLMQAQAAPEKLKEQFPEDLVLDIQQKIADLQYTLTNMYHSRKFNNQEMGVIVDYLKNPSPTHYREDGKS